MTELAENASPTDPPRSDEDVSVAVNPSVTPPFTPDRRSIRSVSIFMRPPRP